MEKGIKKTSAEWITGSDYEILDPDGWDWSNYEYSFNKEKITIEEFERRISLSTVNKFNKQDFLPKTIESNVFGKLTLSVKELTNYWIIRYNDNKKAIYKVEGGKFAFRLMRKVLDDAVKENLIKNYK